MLKVPVMFEPMNPKPLRDEVLVRLRENLPGRNLYELAALHSIPVSFAGKKNKGWMGQTIEKVAGLKTDSSSERDGADFELKTTSLRLQDGKLVPKETIKITQLNPEAILEENFESSIFWQKLGRLILVGCYSPSPLICMTKQIVSVDLLDSSLRKEIQSFWEDVRYTICRGEMSFLNNLGSSEGLVQLRPLGDGKQMSLCPISGERFPSRAFYATKRLIRLLINQEVP